MDFWQKYSELERGDTLSSLKKHSLDQYIRFLRYVVRCVRALLAVAFFRQSWIGRYGYHLFVPSRVRVRVPLGNSCSLFVVLFLFFVLAAVQRMP